MNADLRVKGTYAVAGLTTPVFMGPGFRRGDGE